MAEETTSPLESQALQNNKGLRNLLASVPPGSFREILQSLPDTKEVKEIKSKYQLVADLRHDVRSILTAAQGWILFSLEKSNTTPCHLVKTIIKDGESARRLQVVENIVEFLDSLDPQSLALGIGLKEAYRRLGGSDEAQPSFKRLMRLATRYIDTDLKINFGLLQKLFNDHPTDQPIIKEQRKRGLKNLEQASNIARCLYGEFSDDYLLKEKEVDLDQFFKEKEREINDLNPQKEGVALKLKVNNHSRIQFLRTDPGFLSEIIRDLVSIAVEFRPDKNTPAEVVIELVRSRKKELKVSIINKELSLGKEDLAYLQGQKDKEDASRKAWTLWLRLKNPRTFIEKPFGQKLEVESRDPLPGTAFAFRLPLTEKAVTETPLNLIERLLERAEEKARDLELDREKSQGKAAERGPWEQGRATIQHNLNLFRLRMAFLLEKSSLPLPNDPRELID